MTILRHLPNAISRLHKNIFPVLGNGSYIIDKREDIYLDLTSGIGALSTGHSHPKVIEKVKEQAESYVHMPQQVFASHPAQEELTYKIIGTAQTKTLDNIFYTNSGSEATDNALKIATKYTGKSNIACIAGGFHGRTIAALSVTSSNTNCRNGVRPLLSNIYFCDKKSTDDIDMFFDKLSPINDTAAILLESVQGEGGIYSLDKSYLQYLRNICDTHGILLIADEVQCGSMRTGSWWDIESKGIRPDIITFGKGIASGYPLAGVLSTSKIMNSLGKGYLGGTYGGNAISSAASIATIDILNDPHVKENVNTIGKYIKDELKDEYLIKEIRQHGLMIAIEFSQNNSTPEFASFIVDVLRDNGILVLLCGNKGQFIRLLPPLLVTKEEIDEFLGCLKKILYEIDYY
tara:strand:+ start:720 stop:1931 length:1212 start_codon:yes stop_codon:yes gene_type:complete